MLLLSWTLRAQSHLPCDHVATDVRPGQRASRRQSQKNRATSLSDCVQSHDQNQSRIGRQTCSKYLLQRSKIAGCRTQDLNGRTTGCTTTRRRFCMIVGDRCRKTGGAIVVRPHDQLFTPLCGHVIVARPFLRLCDWWCN